MGQFVSQRRGLRNSGITSHKDENPEQNTGEGRYERLETTVRTVIEGPKGGGFAMAVWYYLILPRAPARSRHGGDGVTAEDDGRRDDGSAQGQDRIETGNTGNIYHDSTQRQTMNEPHRAVLVPESALEDVERVLRDHEHHDGDGSVDLG